MWNETLRMAVVRSRWEYSIHKDLDSYCITGHVWAGTGVLCQNGRVWGNSEGLSMVATKRLVRQCDVDDGSRF